jgi:hypothetical protein
VRIHVVQTGGLAGLRNEQRLDTESLPVEQQRRLTQLVHGVSFFSLEPRRCSRLPDLIQYRLRIEEGDQAHEVQFDDACEDPALLELMQEIAELARSVRKA